MSENNKNKYQHNDDGTTYIFVESKNKYFPGKHTIIIDTEDWDKVKEYTWGITDYGNNNNQPYSRTKVGGNKNLSLHHLIAGKPTKGMVVDHVKHASTLDNRKSNLRVVSYSQNAQNRIRNRNKESSQYKGVYWRKDTSKWRAMIMHKGRLAHIGHYACEHEAALAYNKKALKLWGEYALLNEVGTSGA